MKPIRWKALTGFLLAMLLSAPAWAIAPTTPPPTQRPSYKPAPAGTINYVEGEASLGEQSLTQDSIGSVEMRPGQVLTTGADGKVEVLLGAGIFLRVGDNSMARMLASNPAEVELTQGQATVTVLPNEPPLVLVHASGTTARLVKDGFYEFDADRRQVYVYKGEAQVQVGDRTVKVKGGRMLALSGSETLKATKFDKKQFENTELVQFSGLRAEYLAEANTDAAHSYYVNSNGWYGSGWYWDPAYWTYTWVPGRDYCYDPFGWGFFSPVWVVESPFLFTGFFGDFGINSFGHRRFGRDRLPHSFSARTGHGNTGTVGFSAGAPAMANRAGAAPGAFSHPAFNHSGFNHGTVSAGGIRGGAVGGGAMRGGTMGSGGGAHTGGFSVGGLAGHR
jgi:hypothetical protein